MDDQAQGISPAEQIARLMATLGFEPKQASNPLYSEYIKVYAVGGGGDLGQVTVVFDRGLSGGDPPVLSGFVFTVQYCRRPEWEDVEDALKRAKDEALEYARGDAKVIVEKLLAFDRQSEVVTIECGKCHRVTSEYVTVEGGVQRCLECAEVTAL